jgi:hypothetical protein
VSARSPIEFTFDREVSSRWRLSMQLAAAWWNAHAGTEVLTESPDGSVRIRAARLLDAYGETTWAIDEYGSIAAAEVVYDPDAPRATATMMHEFGHVLGLDHDNESTLMRCTGSACDGYWDCTITDEQRAFVRAYAEGVP